MRWLVMGALLAVALGKADAPQLVNSITTLVQVSAPYVHQLGTAIQGSVVAIEHAPAFGTQGASAAPGGAVQGLLVPQSAGTRQGAPGAGAGVYSPSTGTGVLSDGVVTVDATVDEVFGMATYLSRGTAFYISPTLAMTAQHVTMGHLGPRVTAGNAIGLDVTSEAPGLDVTFLTPYHGMLTATVPAATPLPTVYHPLEARRPAVGEQLTALCRYDRDQAITPVQVVVTNPQTTVTEYLDEVNITRQVPGMGLQVTAGDEHQGCSGAPIVDATGGTVGVVLTGNGHGGMGAASSADIIPWLQSMHVPGY